MFRFAPTLGGPSGGSGSSAAGSRPPCSNCGALRSPRFPDGANLRGSTATCGVGTRSKHLGEPARPPVRMVYGCSSCVTGRTLLQGGIGNFCRARKRLVVVRDGPVQSAECLRIAEERVLFLKVESPVVDATGPIRFRTNRITGSPCRRDPRPAEAREIRTGLLRQSDDCVRRDCSQNPATWAVDRRCGEVRFGVVQRVLPARTHDARTPFVHVSGRSGGRAECRRPSVRLAVFPP
jgi:hypothetical protein